VTTYDREASGRRLRLTPPTSALLIVDVQDKLVQAMPHEVTAHLIKNVLVLVDAAARFDIPILVSEQYPKGLGKTAGPIADALSGCKRVYRWEKTVFSAVAAPEFVRLDVPRDNVRPVWDQWIMCGMETHVCIYQTVRDITGWGSTVHVVSDAVASRTKANYRIGLDLARDAGALVTSTEVVIFDLLGKAEGDHFKALSKAIK
jgi:nicotinamidase-related amidase